jgi:hypothetical protein
VSIEAINWALNAVEIPADTDPRKRPHLKFVLIGLANHANPNGKDAFPSIDTLSRYTMLSESTVRRCLQDLVTLGFIREGDPELRDLKIRQGNHRPTVYDLIMDRGVIRAEGCQNESSGVSHGPENTPGMTPKPSFNQEKEPTTPEPGGTGTQPATPVLQAVPDLKPEQGREDAGQRDANADGLSVNQRATRLAQDHYDRLGRMGNVPAWTKIVRKALEHGYNPDTTRAALDHIADHNWTLTEERLANTLRGGPRKPTSSPARPAQPTGTRPTDAAPASGPIARTRNGMEIQV